MLSLLQDVRVSEWEKELLNLDVLYHQNEYISFFTDYLRIQNLKVNMPTEHTDCVIYASWADRFNEAGLFMKMMTPYERGLYTPD